MSNLADLYVQLRTDIAELVSELEPDVREMPVPATPGWSIRDIIAHLAADATCVIRADFPREFFQSFGDAAAVAVLNDWTGRQIEQRRGRSVQELLDEWTASGDDVVAMMRGEKPWPEDTFMFMDRILVTDAAVHQQDLFGALSIERARDGGGIKVGLSGYIAMMGWRLSSSGLLPLRFDVGDKAYTAGDGEPGATVRASRFEFFRAMSGRRSPEQIAAYGWDGDAQAYIPYFYPYGIRKDALVE